MAAVRERILSDNPPAPLQYREVRGARSPPRRESRAAAAALARAMTGRRSTPRRPEGSGDDGHGTRLGGSRRRHGRIARQTRRRRRWNGPEWRDGGWRQ
jgi:hypothetical protein